MGRGAHGSGPPEQNELYTTAVAEHGRMLDRLAAGYEADPDKRRDLRQEIHLQLWRSFTAFDGRCSPKTWALRVAHNTAASYVLRERRVNSKLVSFEEMERTLQNIEQPRDLDRCTSLREIQTVILQLKPVDRQIIISYIEGMDAASIAEITGLSAANIAMKIHRIKKILAHRMREEQSHA
ncbi:MAG: sigma-70 family RNA polymerase sigma factor [Candidatus Solibacter sp.]